MRFINPFVRKLLALASAAAILISIIPTVRAAQAPSEVSAQRTSLEAPTMEALIPDHLRELSTVAPLNRRNLCSMVMSVYKSMTGLTDEDLGGQEAVFIDSCDQDVLNAYTLGLVTADDSGFFFPSEAISRQNFFASATKLLELLAFNEIDAPTDDTVPTAETLRNIGVIPDTESQESSPEITVGEAVLIMDRVVSFLNAGQEDQAESRRDVGAEAAATALTRVGCRYVSGGHGPRKFDCSGLVYWVYKQYGYNLKPGARNQWSMLGDSIKKADLRPGDLLFYSKNGRASGIFHVGIYIGDGQFVHAANSRKGVIVTDLDESWYASRYLGAKRAIS